MSSEQQQIVVPRRDRLHQRVVLLVSVALPRGGINVTFTSVGDIEVWKVGWGYAWKMHPENLRW